MSYIKIPEDVERSEHLCPMSKLLFGRLAALSQKEGYCWATNQHLADWYKCSLVQVSRWISELSRVGFIEAEYNKTTNTRRITLKHKEASPPLIKNDKTPYQKSGAPLIKNDKTPYQKRHVKNNITEEEKIISVCSTHTLFSEKFKTLYEQYKTTLGDATPLSSSKLFAVLLDKEGVKLVSGNDSGVNPIDAAKIEAALSCISQMTADHAAQKADFEQNGKGWFKKSFKSLLANQIYLEHRESQKVEIVAKTAQKAALSPRLAVINALISQGHAEKTAITLYEGQRSNFFSFIKEADSQKILACIERFLIDTALVVATMTESGILKAFSEWSYATIQRAKVKAAQG